MTIHNLVDAACKCAKCGAGLGRCGCFVKCWCGLTRAKDDPCEREHKHDQFKLLEMMYASFNCMCENGLRQGPAKECAERRAHPNKSPCQCVCHRKVVRDVLVIENAADAQQRCPMIDSDTDEQCTQSPNHDGGCTSATALAIELNALKRIER